MIQFAHCAGGRLPPDSHVRFPRRSEMQGVGFMNGELHQAPTGGMQPPLTDDEMLALVGVSNPEVVRLISSTLGRELCLAVFRAMLSRDSASRDFLAMLLAQLSE